MVSKINNLLQDDNLRERFSQKASEAAYNRFNINTQTEKYLKWYEHTVKK